MSVFMRGVLADMNALESCLAASELDWTSVRPVNLKDEPSSRTLMIDRPGPIGANEWVSRAEVATFLLDALADASTFKRAVLLSERRAASDRAQRG